MSRFPKSCQIHCRKDEDLIISSQTYIRCPRKHGTSSINIFGDQYVHYISYGSLEESSRERFRNRTRVTQIILIDRSQSLMKKQSNIFSLLL
uniref:Uncharacterized protein n=1 Tax=Rhizophora mucronata TaxID=61149 RepID=A0A2P2JW18_RHIMU